MGDQGKNKGDREREGPSGFFVDYRRPVAGGVVAAVLAVGGGVVVGGISGAEARVLLQSMLPTTRFLCSAVMTASATTLALMLTLLSLSHSTETTLRPYHYLRVRQIALLDVAAFIGATVLLLLLNIPLEESEKVPSGWYDTIYYVMIGMASLLGGLLVTVMLMLYDAVRDLIGIVHPTSESDLIMEEEEM